jgi:hypothetical protein
MSFVKFCLQILDTADNTFDFGMQAFDAANSFLGHFKFLSVCIAGKRYEHGIVTNRMIDLIPRPLNIS